MIVASDNICAKSPFTAGGVSRMFVVCLSGCCHSLYVEKYLNITVRYMFSLTIRLIGINFWPTLACTIPLRRYFFSIFLKFIFAKFKLFEHPGISNGHKILDVQFSYPTSKKGCVP